MDLDAILAEADERRQRLAEQRTAYDPVRGIGSHLERIEIPLQPGVSVHVPAAQADAPITRRVLEAGSVQALADARDQPYADVYVAFCAERNKYDVEFWYASCVRIKDKSGKIVPLVLNAPQRKSLAERERLRFAGKPIRQIELKHRQYGSTTEKNAYVAWFQNIYRRGLNAYVLGLDTDQATEIVARYDTIARHYPLRDDPIQLAGYYGASNTKSVVGRDCFLAIGSAERPNAPSGRTVQLALISEAGKMKSTTAKGADKLITNIVSMVPLQADTLICVESTAEESGQWFKSEIEKAQAGRSAFHFTFVSWIDDPSRVAALEDLDVREWIRSWSEYDETLWHLGATLEQIRWYQLKEAEYPEPWMMKQENPSTPEEAWQYGERRVFATKYVQQLKGSCKAPIAIGDLVADGETGKAALENIKFVENPRGKLRIWRWPGDDYSGIFTAERYAHRYAAASDVGGQWEGADYSVTAILDRIPRLMGGMSEIVAELHLHEDHDLFAWYSARLALWYGRAFWAVEANSFDRRDPDERAPEAGLTVIEEIKDYYPQLYHREVYDSTKQEIVYKAGWWTDKRTKPLMISKLQKALRAYYRRQVEQDEDELDGLIERSLAATQEMESYLHVEGRMEAAPGKKDDRVIVRALLAFLDQDMPEPKAVEKRTPRRRQHVGAAGR